MAFCDFPDWHRGTSCRRCGWTLPIEFEKKPVKACVIIATCIYRGDVTRSVTYRTRLACKKIRSVMGCELHGECVPFRPAAPNLKCCETCGSFIPTRSARTETG